MITVPTGGAGLGGTYSTQVSGTDTTYLSAMNPACPSSSCGNFTETEPGGPPGSPGGMGGYGGTGGGGAGGWSVGTARVDSGTITVSAATTVKIGKAGAGGSPNGLIGVAELSYSDH